MIAYRSKMNLCILVTSIFILIEIILALCPASEELITFNKYLSCLFLVWSYMVAYISKKGFFYPYTLFLISFTTFIYSRLIMDVMGLHSFDEGGAFSHVFYFTHEVKHRIILAISFATLFLTLGALCAFKKSAKTSIRPLEETFFTKVMGKCGLCLIVISILPFLILKVKLAMDIASNGYAWLYMDGGIKSNMSLADKMLDLSDNVFYMGTYLYFATYPKGRLYKFILLLFVVGSVLELGSGQRGTTIIQLFFVLTYCGCRGLRLSLKKVFAFSLLFFFFLYFSFVFATARNSSLSNMGSVEIGALSQVAEIFFWQQGVTLDLVVGETIRMEDQLPNQALYVFNPFYAFLFGSPLSDLLGIRTYHPFIQNKDKVEKSWGLGAKLMYNIDAVSYYNGAGTGSSLVAEAYCFGGLIGVSVWSFLFMYYPLIFWEKYRNDPAIFFLLIVGLGGWYYSPRSEMLSFVGRVFQALIFISGIILLVRYVPRKKVRMANKTRI